MKAEIYYFIRHLQSCRYSDKTIRLYLHQIQSYLDYFKTDPRLISESQIQDYVYNRVFRNNFSSSYQNVMISALKIFYHQVIKQPLDNEILIRPRKSKYLPEVLSKEEIRAIINSITNLKHRTIISTIYACGLRISELINLQIRDIDSKRMIIFIRQSKGRKDRVIPLPSKLLEILRKYWLVYKPKYYLFEGITSEKYGKTSVAKILNRAVKENKINKRITVHSLRHSYATHLMDAGVNLRFIQTMLGHKSVRTTEIYTHVSNLNLHNVYSPYDDIG